MCENRTNSSDTGIVSALMWIVSFIIILALNAYAGAGTLPDPTKTPSPPQYAIG
jgi:hypothetical protein